MIRCSSLHRVCSNRLEDNSEKLKEVKEELEQKVKAKKMSFSEDDIDLYLRTQGLITAAKNYVVEKEKNVEFLRDDLPIGAKSYMKELWLEHNYGFVPVSLGSEAIPILKGKLVEEDAIKLISSFSGIEMVKNTERKSKDFLTGEVDLLHKDIIGDNIVGDNKSPISWNSFRNKVDIPTEYFWQLIGYCDLYDARQAIIYYTLMPTPLQILEEAKERIGEEGFQTQIKINETINNLPIEYRVKSFKIEEDIEENISFMRERVKKCEQYYNTLTYEICMNIK